LSEESSEQSEAGEEEPISDKQHQERGQEKGALRQSVKTVTQQYQSGREAVIEASTRETLRTGDCRGAERIIT